MAMLTIIISLLALTLSAYTYLKHDSIIKKQSKLINQYKLEKIEAEKINSKKAIIEANVIPERGKRTIVIYNKGKCIAKNVEVMIPESDFYIVFSNPCPININPLNSVSVILGGIANGCPNKIDVTFKWEDDTNAMNETTQTLQID